MTKQQALSLLQALPDDISPSQLSLELEKIGLKAIIEASRAELRRGEGIPHEEVERRLARWLED